MCLNRISELKIAEKDIFVWKRFHLTNYNLSEKNRELGINELKSPYRNENYQLGLTYKAKFDKYHRYSYVVNKGIHAYISFKAANSRKNYSEVIIKCTIPKGSQYYLGNREDIVSNQLILPETFKWKGYEYTANYE